MSRVRCARLALAACLAVTAAHRAWAADVAAFDFDANGRVDSQDAASFFACDSGPALPAGGGGCPAQTAYTADRDGDLDVDQSDFGAFQRCFSGTRPARFDCAPPIPPLPLLGAVAGHEDTPLLLTLTAFDPHSEPLAISLTITALPAQGQLSQADGTPINTVPALVTDPDGKLRYLAEPNMFGAAYASFGYTATSLASGLTSVSRTVSIDMATVNDWPIQDLTPPVTTEDTPVTFELKAFDPDVGDSLYFQVAEAPVLGTLYQVDENGVPQLDQPLVQGTLVTNPQQLVHYVPRANFYGTDSVRLYALDQTGPGPLTSVLPIHVSSINDSPFALSESFEWPNRQGPGIGNINLQVGDVDTLPSAVQVCITTLPAIGVLSTFPDGVLITQVPFCTNVRHFEYLYPNAADLGLGCVVPPADLATHFPLDVASFTYEAFDGQASSPPARVDLGFVYSNTAPYVTSPLEHTTDEDVPTTFTLSAADIEGDMTLFAVYGPPTHGTILRDGEVPLYPVLLFNNTTLTFVPEQDFNTAGGALATWPFEILDPDGARDCQYAATFTINPVNDPPNLLAPAYADSDGLTYVQYGWFPFVVDDAIPSALLKAELIGTGVASVSVVAPSGLAGFEQVSPGHVRLEGTLSALDATLNVGVSVTVLPGNPPGATLEITIDDQGNSGSGTPYTASLLIPVEVSPPLE